MNLFLGFLNRLREGETMTAEEVKDFCKGQVKCLRYQYIALQIRMGLLCSQPIRYIFGIIRKSYINDFVVHGLLSLLFSVISTQNLHDLICHCLSLNRLLISRFLGTLNSLMSIL